ncbi:hypothetical protein [Dyadobacter crusticola]|uniref:hypothetical protein n=1 Tax=Dyadobacter crusticola TaxID=292407 RepID=UPI0004E14033|nr:hypothetical protein [Dyadobacter crusticola]
MNTFQNSANKTANCTETNPSQTEHVMINDVRDFFSTDSCAEIIGSMNALLETVLFSKDVENVTPEMRVDIANQLRAVTLISKLNEKNRRVSC